ncbi:hypothetical protein Tsubulata_042732, partial [Turnera subulata]
YFGLASFPFSISYTHQTLSRKTIKEITEMSQIPEVELSSGHKMPLIAMGTSALPLPPAETLISAFIDAIECGYRHFDTAALYGSEESLGRAIAAAVERGLIKNRQELFVTSKVWCNENQPHLILPALKKSLERLGLEYVDLYLIHFPLAVKQEVVGVNITPEDILPLFDMKGTWEAMEECSRLGLAKSIGVSNYSFKKLSQLLEHATIPPAVDQVEMNVGWQQKKLLDFCKKKGIHVSAWSPLAANGAEWGSLAVMQSPVLKEIALSRGKSVAQLPLHLDSQENHQRNNNREMSQIPEVELSSGRKMPMIAMGTAAPSLPPAEILTSIFIDAIECGYRHFDTAALYGSEASLGKAIAAAVERGLIKNRQELFVTSKVWCNNNQPHLILPALKKSLERLGLEYVDLYLIHFPIAVKQEVDDANISPEDILPFFDMKGTWEAMEECSRLGLAKSIGVSNYSFKKLSQLLEHATIPPAVDQVEMNVGWQQKKLLQFCKKKGIHVSAWSPLAANGAEWGSLAVMQSPVLKEIALPRGKSVAQMGLRWVYEEGATVIVKSFNRERMKQNLQIFDWELSNEDMQKIKNIPQSRGFKGEYFTCMSQIPEVELSSGHKMPMIAMGTAAPSLPPAEILTSIFIDAIECGYRHFDTAALYGSEESLGRAITAAVERGLIKNRQEIFVTTKVWCNDAQPHLILPALKKSLERLGLEYVDLYLIHFPIAIKQEVAGTNFTPEDILPFFDMKGTWEAMEECSRLGLAKSIGVSNYSFKKLSQLLQHATIPPAVDQVQMNVVWQQKKLRDFCKKNGIHVSAWSPLADNGEAWGSLAVMESPILKEISLSRRKTVAQVALRWVHEEGATVIVKSFNKERMKQNLQIFDWELSNEDRQKIKNIPQSRGFKGEPFTSVNGPYKSPEELWDDDEPYDDQFSAEA